MEAKWFVAMNLKAEMARKGITNEQLANEIGINPATMSAKLNIARGVCVWMKRNAFGISFSRE